MMRGEPEFRVTTIGEERQPVIIIDDFAADISALRAEAEARDYAPMGRHYPGVRAGVTAADVAALVAPVCGLIAQSFGFSSIMGVIEAAYSLVTTPPAQLTPIQRLPHFDGLDPARIALLLYLGHEAQGGTAFYRHRSTGYETISPDRHADYDAALRRDVARHGLPAPAYVAGDTPIYQQIARFAAKPNRALIYRGNSLHCADLPASLDFAPNPRTARLTLNIFLQGRI